MFRFDRSYDAEEFAAVAQRIDAIAPVIAANADTAERDARLPEIVARTMARAGLYRLSAPAAAGGGEAHPFTQILTIEKVSAIDGAAGWNLMIGMETLGILSGGLTREQATHLLASPEVIISGALNPKGFAEAVPGGYRVSGQWPFASGCHNCDYFVGQCILTRDGAPLLNDDGTPQVTQVFVPRSDFTIVETWDVDGLRGSGSHDVRITEKFVADFWSASLAQERRFATGPLFRLPLYSRLAYNKVGVATGIARAAIDAFRRHAVEKTPRASLGSLAERGDAQLAVAQAEVELRAARAYTFEAVGEVWETVVDGRRPTTEQRALLQLACSNAASAAVRAVTLVHEVAGSTANFRANPLSRCFRDVQVVRQHIMVSPQWMAASGRVLLGQPSRTFLF